MVMCVSVELISKTSFWFPKFGDVPPAGYAENINCKEIGKSSIKYPPETKNKFAINHVLTIAKGAV